PEVGTRAVGAPTVSDRTLYAAIPGLLDACPDAERERLRRIQVAPIDSILATCTEVLRRWPFDKSRLRPGLGPTIPLHCSDELLTGCRDLAREWQGPLPTHLAEARPQALPGRTRHCRRPSPPLRRLRLPRAGF